MKPTPEEQSYRVNMEMAKDEGYQTSLSSEGRSSSNPSVSSDSSVSHHKDIELHAACIPNRGNSTSVFETNDEETIYSKKQIKKLYCLTCALTVIVAITVITLIILIALHATSWLPVKQRMNNNSSVLDGASSHKNELCLSCKDLKNTRMYNIKIEDHFVIDDKHNLCCVPNLGDFLQMINLISENRINKEIDQGNFPPIVPETGTQSPVPNIRPAAHLAGFHPNSRPGNVPRASANDGDEVKPWITDRHTAFYRNIGIQDSRLLIREKGSYFVYSQIHFIETFAQTQTVQTPTETENRPTAKKYWVGLYRYNFDLIGNNHEQILMQHARSRHDPVSDDASHAQYSAYIGAVLKLEAGDQLLVKVSNISNVSADYKRTYFGAFMV